MMYLRLSLSQCNVSPSSRRAWIEMRIQWKSSEVIDVALLAEGVDRNRTSLQPTMMPMSRPPRGGRG